jgi:Ca2+-binding RTX toxin-like protein
MLRFRLLAVGAGALVLALPTAAHAGTVRFDNGVNTYFGSDAEETITLSGDGGQTVFRAAGVTLGGPGPCMPNGEETDRIDCFTTASTLVNAEGADDRIDASALTGTNVTVNGGVGNDYLLDGSGNDVLNGGPGPDVNIAGQGADVFSGGDGEDSVDYSGRGAPVAINLNGGAVSGQAGEGDTIAVDVEGAYGGPGNDVIFF